MRTLSISLLLTSAAMAQVVSPVANTNLEGNANNTFPWNNAQFTYQQVHGDLRGTPRSVRSLAFRRDATSTTVSQPRTVTLDAFMGEGDLATVTTTFATNYAATPMQVITNKTFNAPSWVDQPIDAPAPFDFVIPLDTPFAYTGNLDLVWEFRLTATAPTGSYVTDAASGTGNGLQHGNRQGMGTGCTTANGVMTLRSNFTTSTTVHSLSWQTRSGPSSAAGVTLVGVTPTNLPFPPVCPGTIWTDGALLQLGGTTTAAGVMNTSVISIPYNAVLVGVTTHAQSAAVDATQPGLGLAASNGLASTIPDVTVAVMGARLWASGNASATTGSIANNYLLVTRFN